MATLTGHLYIDGVDAYTNYGLFVKDDGLKGLLQWPQFKASSIPTVNWHEYDGIEADLSAPVLDGRQFQLSFHINHPDAESEAQVLLSDLTSQVYHTFNFPLLGKTYVLRLVTNPNFLQKTDFDTLSLTFAEDNVAVPTATVPMQETGIPYGYIIDDADFALYGCTVFKGTRDSFLKFASPKPALKVSTITSNGVSYDSGDSVRLSSRDITMHLHIRTANIADFWARWNALWAVVLAPSYRTVEGDGMVFQCYYKSNAISKFLMFDDGGVWCDFTITFAVLSYSRGEEWFYLITEDGYPVIFEDDDSSNPAHYVRIR